MLSINHEWLDITLPGGRKMVLDLVDWTGLETNLRYTLSDSDKSESIPLAPEEISLLTAAWRDSPKSEVFHGRLDRSQFYICAKEIAEAWAGSNL